MRSILTKQICPLCSDPESDEYCQDKHRDYFQCRVCSLVFVPPQYFLSKPQEKAQYDSHQNSPEDLQYRQFLSRLFTPLEKCLIKGSCGLDFGSGPGPTLSVMFEEAGYKVSLYDVYYNPDSSVFNSQYDFVTMSEVVEHLKNPKDEFSHLWDCLKPGGCLGVMTKLVINRDAFAQWHYKNEPTHICFYSQETFRWLADLWKADVAFVDKDVMIFSKKEK